MNFTRRFVQQKMTFMCGYAAYRRTMFISHKMCTTLGLDIYIHVRRLRTRWWWWVIIGRCLPKRRQVWINACTTDWIRDHGCTTDTNNTSGATATYKSVLFRIERSQRVSQEPTVLRTPQHNCSGPGTYVDMWYVAGKCMNERLRIIKSI